MKKTEIKEYIRSVVSYLTTVKIAKDMLKKELINQDEFYLFEDKIARKYNIQKSSIYRIL